MSEDSALNSFVDQVTACFRTQAAPAQSLDFAGLTLPQAYAIQQQYLARRVAAGEKIVGWKVGCTSAAIRRQFGLDEAISGRLTEPGIFRSGEKLAADSFVNCAVEPELVFRLGEDLDADVSENDVWKALDGVSAGIELHNYRFWLGRPTSQELISSNGIHAGLVHQELQPIPPARDLQSEMVSVLVNGKVRAAATCAEIQGGPLRSIAWLAKHAAQRGQKLLAGELIIPGSAVELVNVSAGDQIEARFASLPSCFARII